MIELVGKQESLDASVKLLWKSDKSQLFESVILPFYSKGLYTICISSQAGCNCGCKICETSNYSYSDTILNLSYEDIIAQATKSEEIGKERCEHLKLGEIALMGMGEPLLNLDNVLTASEYLINQGNQVAISTIGIPAYINRLIEFPFKNYPRLQLSMHGFESRKTIIPLDEQFPVIDSYNAALIYAKKTYTPLFLNWVLIKGLNNSPLDASRLGELLDPEHCYLNITTYVGTKFTRASPNEKEKFINMIVQSSLDHHKTKLRVYSFETMGSDVNAACGQLVGKYST